MQMTVGQLGRASLQIQTLHVRAVESGMQCHDLIELPPDILISGCESAVMATPNLEEYAGNFLDRKKNTLKPGTYNLYDGCLRNGLLPFFGKMVLNSIDENCMQEFVAMLSRKGRAISYIQTHIVVLKSILRGAERDGLLKVPPVQIVYPKRRKKEIFVLSDEDTEKLNDYLLDDRKTISTALLVALHTGIRIGEMCGLRWSDIDFRKKCIHIQRSVKNYYVQAERRCVREIGETKTIYSNRRIYMTDDFADILQKRQGTGFIYTGTDRYIDTCSARQALNRRLNKLDIPHVRFHALRHGFATRAIQKGVDPKTVAAILGHAHCNITLDIYTSCTSEMQIEAMRRLETKK